MKQKVSKRDGKMKKLAEPRRIEWSRIKTMQLPHKTCLICGERLERKYYGIRYHRRGCRFYKYHHWETTARFLARKTCSLECRRKLQSGEGNPNYKGIMPICVDCGKKISYKGKKGKWTRCLRCRKCFIKWARKTNYFPNTKQALYIAEKMRKTKGTLPKRLKPFLFKKGKKI